MNKSAKNWTLGLLAVAALAFAGWRLTRPSGADIQIPTEVLSPAVCLSCKQEVEVKRSLRDPGPYQCPACSSPTAYVWLYCQECNYRFLPNLVAKEGRLPRANPFPYCTHCGCETVAAYDPTNPEQSPAGDAPLPRIP